MGLDRLHADVQLARAADLAPAWLWGLPVLALGVAAILIGILLWTGPAGDETAAGRDGEDDAPPAEDATG